MVIWYILWLFGICYGYLVYVMVIWYMLWLFGICYGYLVYVMVIWYMLWLFGIFYSYLVYFEPFGRLCHEKSGNPDIGMRSATCVAYQFLLDVCSRIVQESTF
jgi:hypothetical protein